METDDLIGFDKENYEAGGTGWASESKSEIPEDTAGKGELRQVLPPKVTEDTEMCIRDRPDSRRRFKLFRHCGY